MNRTTCDIVIGGGGIAGLSTACVFGSAGFSVICAEPTTPAKDLRTTAILQPAQAILQTADVWQTLAPHACPLKTMRLIDASNNTINTTADFHASEISPLPFGWNVVNWRLRDALIKRIATLPNVQILPLAVAGVTARKNHCLVRLANDQQIETALLIGADGRDSFIRETLNIPLKRWTYGQKVLAFHATHPDPHNNISTEIHNNGGPFTLVPMTPTTKNHSAVVWMDKADKIDALMNMKPSDFKTALNLRAGGILGGLTAGKTRQSFPVISQQARNLTAPHCALMAEAAHVLPPIGAQGLNMSFADIACLLRTAQTHELGSPKMLTAYETERRHAIRLRMAGVDVLNRASISNAAPVRMLRMKTLQSLMTLAPLRQMVMQSGLNG